MATKGDWCGWSIPGADRKGVHCKNLQTKMKLTKSSCFWLSPWASSSDHSQWCHALFQGIHFHCVSSLVSTGNRSLVFCCISGFSCFRHKTTFLCSAIDLQRWLPQCGLNLPLCIASLVFPTVLDTDSYRTCTQNRALLQFLRDPKHLSSFSSMTFFLDTEFWLFD